MHSDLAGICKLGETECQCLDRVLARTPKLLELARKCRDAGWDVEPAENALQEQLEMARKAKATFFPNRV